MTDPLSTARALARPVLEVGGRFMFQPDTMGEATAGGYPNGLVFYFRGRGGVLGEVDADVIVAGFGFFRPDLVRATWEAGVAVEPAREAGHRFASACADYGRARLTGVEGIERVAELVERVVGAADASGLSLFAGWRAEPLPDDPPGRAYQLLHVLRELRGSAHVVAVRAGGLSPLEAILAGGAGPDQARLFGWAGDLPDVAHLAEAREQVEAQTDRIAAPAYEALSVGEQGELIELVGRIKLVLRG